MGFFVTLGVFFFCLFGFSFPFISATCIIEGFYDRHVVGAKSEGAALIDDISRRDIHGFYGWAFGISLMQKYTFIQHRNRVT